MVKLRWILLALFLGAGHLATEPRPLTAHEPQEHKTVRLTIDYGDGVQKVFAGLAWQERATVFSALEAAAKHPRGIKFEHRGSGATTLVTSIDGLKNEGRGRNWLYEVNGKLGETSCAVAEIKPGDAVLWRFATYR